MHYIGIVTGSENLMSLLIENGADVNAVCGKEGKTALIYAALNGNSHGRVFYIHTIRDANSLQHQVQNQIKRITKNSSKIQRILFVHSFLHRR